MVIDRTEAPLRVLVLPHWTMGGGAGFYIQNLISALRTIADVRIGGVHRNSYMGETIDSRPAERLALLSFPMYEGIRASATVFHLALSAIRFAALFMSSLWTAVFPKEKTVDVVVLTSSVQAMAIPLARRIFPGSELIILIQENVDLTSVLGRWMLWLLRRADGVVSISNAWSDHAQSKALDTVLLRNSYSPSYLTTTPESGEAHVSDILYTGGDGAIKGFASFRDALPLLLSRAGVKIICLGNYSEEARAELEAIRKGAHLDARLVVIGLVPDIRPYLMRTSILLLPLGNAHFCRAAIEAGFFGKSFIIPQLKGLEDFAWSEKNCLTYPAGNVGALVKATAQMLDDQHLRARLGQENRRNSEQFLLTDAELIKIIGPLLPDVRSVDLSGKSA